MAILTGWQGMRESGWVGGVGQLMVRCRRARLVGPGLATRNAFASAGQALLPAGEHVRTRRLGWGSGGTQQGEIFPGDGGAGERCDLGLVIGRRDLHQIHSTEIDAL
jgi:hypothetical protein